MPQRPSVGGETSCPHLNTSMRRNRGGHRHMPCAQHRSLSKTPRAFQTTQRRCSPHSTSSRATVVIELSHSFPSIQLGNARKLSRTPHRTSPSIPSVGTHPQGSASLRLNRGETRAAPEQSVARGRAVTSRVSDQPSTLIMLSAAGAEGCCVCSAAAFANASCHVSRIVVRCLMTSSSGSASLRILALISRCWKYS